MKVFLDDTEVAAPDATLGAALDACRREAEGKGRMIVEVWADGERTPDDDLAEPPTFSPYADEIRMVSADPRALVAHTLLEASDVLGEMAERQRRIAADLQVGKTTDALGGLGDVLTVWDGARRAVVEGSAILGGDPLSLLPEDKRAGYTEATERLTSALTELLDLMRAGDLTGVADILEGELADEAPQWQDILSALADSVLQTGASA